MSSDGIRSRLSEAAKFIASNDPTFDNSCARRMSLGEWFQALAEFGDMKFARQELEQFFRLLPVTDAGLVEWLRTVDARQIPLPPGATAPPPEVQQCN